MTYEELKQEYIYLYNQSWCKIPNTENMTYDDLLTEVTGMYAFINDLSKGALK
jgi:hypothetical protein